MRRGFVFAASVLLSLSAAAHADAVRVFDFNGTLDPNTGTGGSVFGTITLDTTSGTYLESSLSSRYGSTTYAVSSVETTYATTNGSLVILSFGSSTQPNDAVLSLVLPTTSLVNYAGGSICTDVARCSQANNSNYTSSYFAPSSIFGDGFVTGNLSLPPVPPTPVAATPEPSCIALMGTGLVGMAGVLRRRLA